MYFYIYLSLCVWVCGGGDLRTVCWSCCFPFTVWISGWLASASTCQAVYLRA